MLTELRIRDFAIIDDLNIQFGEGLITFTGETGAGKSIIIDAVETLLGSRVDTTFIRNDAEKATVEGDFYIHPDVRPAVHALLEEEELLDDPQYLTLGREIRQNGRNVARVNGRMVNLALLKSLSQYLVDVHGQSEHLSLLRVKEHLGLLDAFANTGSLKTAYRSVFNQLKSVQTELSKLLADEESAARRADLLLFQVEEINATQLQPGEEDDLRDERNRLANAESLAALAQEALFLLDEGDPENPPISDQLGQVVEALGQLARIDKTQSSTHDQIEEIFESLSDLSRTVALYLEQVDYDPNRLTEVEERINLIQNLKRKYGESIEKVLAYGIRAAEELDAITHAEERIGKLEKEETILIKQLTERAIALSQARHQAGEELSRLIEAELNHLRMAGAQFGVEYLTQPDPDGLPISTDETVAYDADGFETIQFLVAPNPGEGLKPLARIASGGETSRLMLALKNVLATADKTPTLIFDEIDQGIGGRVGAIVGQKLWNLSRRHQVLCITHLPQLAAFGGQHYRVMKVVHDGRTSTKVEQLDGENRLQELAQMLGDVSFGTLQSALEIMQQVTEITGK